ncbi:MAG: hypothetical protein HN509_06750 [Halobacteriovoraceae bacterium]|jgi:hypothetical protein|nr:hypothetical protein [Halobacteriovoraceae bacterium]MBT5094714.1 hypothetical protein [Halobacteriovoraceae bacterium]
MQQIFILLLALLISSCSIFSGGTITPKSASKRTPLLAFVDKSELKNIAAYYDGGKNQLHVFNKRRLQTGIENGAYYAVVWDGLSQYAQVPVSWGDLIMKGLTARRRAKVIVDEGGDGGLSGKKAKENSAKLVYNAKRVPGRVSKWHCMSTANGDSKDDVRAWGFGTRGFDGDTSAILPLGANSAQPKTRGHQVKGKGAKMIMEWQDNIAKGHIYHKGDCTGWLHSTPPFYPAWVTEVDMTWPAPNQ